MKLGYVHSYLLERQKNLLVRFGLPAKKSVFSFTLVYQRLRFEFFYLSYEVQILSSPIVV